MRLSAARLYLVAPTRLAAGNLADLVDELADAGVDLIQLREKELEAGDLLRVGEPILTACRRAGIPFIVNDRPDVALALGADGVHLGQNDLPVAIARRILHEAIVGRSTHSWTEIETELERDDIDYIAVGPVYETPTKPGREPVGLDLVRATAGTATALPWFAIGGINAGNTSEVIEAGARRIVVVRAIAEAADPARAASELRSLLEAAG